MLAWSPMMERSRAWLRTWISWMTARAWNLGEQHGGGHFVHAHGVARDFVLQAVHHLRIEAVVLLPQLLVGTGVQRSLGGVLVVVGHEDAAFTGAHAFARLGGKATDVTEGTEGTSAPRRAVRVSAVFDEEEVMLLDDLHHRVHVGHVAAHVGHQEDLRAGFGHFAVEVFGVHAPLAVRFDQHGLSTGVVDHAWHGVEGERVGQDLVAGFHAGDVERDVHRRATGIGADGVLHAHVLGEGLLEARRERVFLGRWLVAVHDAASHGVGRHGNAFLWNGLERLVVEVDDALAAFDNKSASGFRLHGVTGECRAFQSTSKNERLCLEDGTFRLDGLRRTSRGGFRPEASPRRCPNRR